MNSTKYNIIGPSIIITAATLVPKRVLTFYFQSFMALKREFIASFFLCFCLSRLSSYDNLIICRLNYISLFQKGVLTLAFIINFFQRYQDMSDSEDASNDMGHTSRIQHTVPALNLSGFNETQQLKNLLSPLNVKETEMPSGIKHTGPISSTVDGNDGYRPPKTMIYKSECQSLLEGFMHKFKENPGQRKNERDNIDNHVVPANQDGVPDHSEKKDNENILDQMFKANAPVDAKGCHQIQTLAQYLEGTGSEVKNPKTQFFDLSRKYYTGRYHSDNKKEITVKSYLITEDYQNYVRDLSMEIIQTNQGCFPIIKTFEANAYNKNKFVKALKFYNYRSDCKLRKQIIVDEGVMNKRFRTYDTSLLHFGNYIIFYMREENWHKLQKYNVVTNQQEEIEGYNIEEPIGQEQRYHMMFSNEFGKDKKRIIRKNMTVEEFVESHYAFAQSYQINEQLKYINKELIGFNLRKYEVQKFYQEVKTNEILENAVQYVCHIRNNNNNQVTFIAFDSWNSHHFNYDPQRLTQTTVYKTFEGNNEVQMQNIDKLHETSVLGIIDENNQRDAANQSFMSYRTSNNVNEEDAVDQIKHDKFSPFLKHQNSQFLIQKEKVTLKIIEKNKVVDQYFYMTNDNQYMLIYPNYENKEQKHQVIFQIAKKFQYNQNPDVDYQYQDDFETRQRDFVKAEYKKIAHVCSNEYASKNHMKRAEHLKRIIQYPRDFHIFDKLILSTDQERSLIFVYQSHVVDGNNKIEIYNYENNISYANQQRTLPVQIRSIFDDQCYRFGKSENNRRAQANNYTYYVNSKFRSVVSTNTHIETDYQQQIRLEDGEISQTLMRYHLEKHNSEMFMIIERKDGSYHNIRVKQDHLMEPVHFQMYTKNKFYYTFFFTMVNDRERLNIKHHFFAIRKTVKEIEEMSFDNNLSLIQMEQDITVFVKNDFNRVQESENLAAYTQQMTFRQLIDEQHEYEKQQGWIVNLAFEKCLDNRAQIDFLPMIYQVKGNLLSHHMIVFDIDKMKVVRHTSVLSSMKNREYLRKNVTGFVDYTITRTSEVFTQARGFFENHSCTNEPSSQVVKYQVSTQYWLPHAKPKVSEEQEQLRVGDIAKTTLELTEYCVHYSCCFKNKIQLIGRKQMLLSELAQQKRNQSFDEVLMLPYFTERSLIKGSQFVLKEDNQVIYMLDQEINNIYQQKTTTLQYGYQKFLTAEDSHDEYILVVASQLCQRVYMGEHFENSESYWINRKVQKKMMSMQLAKFEYFVLNDDFEALMRREFYQAQQVLEGKSLNDLCLAFPREVAQGLKQTQEQFSSIKGSLAEEICNADPDQMAALEHEMELCESNLLIQLDFNFCSTLRLAAELNSNQSVKILLLKLFDMNEIAYQDILMMELPRMLQLPRIERLYDFLERDFNEAKTIEKENQEALAHGEKQMKSKYLNFEDFLNHPNLPPFMSRQINYHMKERFNDHHNSEQEVISEIVEKNPYMTWSIQTMGEDVNILKRDKREKEEKNIEVEHSMIDFQKVIIGEKIRFIQEKNFRKVSFNDNHLADIMWVEDPEYLSFYNLETVRKVVDFQFVKTKWFLQYAFMFYSCGFLIPFILSMSIESALWLNLLFTLCLFTQIFFAIFEVLQLKEQRLEYFKDVWNLVDTSQFVFFCILYMIKMLSQFQSDTLFEILLQAVLLIQTFYKTVYYLRMYDQIAQILIMGGLIVTEIAGYIIFMGVLLLCFCKQYTVMHLDVNDPTGAYSDIQSSFMKLMIQTYVSSSGDINIPALDTDMDERLTASPFYSTVLFGLNMLVWIAQQLIFGFSGVYFMGQVLQAYEKNYPQLRLLMYKNKAKFNNESFDILDMFIKQRNFKVICFAVDKELKFKYEAEWQGTAHRVIRSIREGEDSKALERNGDRDEVKKVQTKQELTQETCMDMAKQIEQLHAALLRSGDRRCCCERR